MHADSHDPTARAVSASSTTVSIALSGARTPIHFVYVASWLRHFLDATDDSVVLTDLDRPSGISPAERAVLPDSARFTVATTVAPGPVHADLYIAVGAPGLKASLHLRRSSRTMRLPTVVVDEGLGSYGTWFSRRAAMRREGTPEPIASARASSVGLARSFLTTERWALYRRVGGRWTVHQLIADELMRCHGPKDRTDRVVYLAQPWVEVGLADEEALLHHLEAVAAVVTNAGFTFRVRRHPLEPVDRYRSFDQLSGDGPAELDPAVYSARAVLGENSTALLNAASVLDVPARSIRGPASARLAMSRSQRELFAGFLPAPVDASELAAALTTM